MFNCFSSFCFFHLDEQFTDKLHQIVLLWFNSNQPPRLKVLFLESNTRKKLTEDIFLMLRRLAQIAKLMERVWDTPSNTVYRYVNHPVYTRICSRLNWTPLLASYTPLQFSMCNTLLLFLYSVKMKKRTNAEIICLSTV